MSGVISRRSLLGGAAGLGAAVASSKVSKRSTAFAAPAVVQDTGSKVKVLYWGSFSDVLGEAEQAMVKMFNESQDEVEVEYQFQGTYEETAQKLTAALQAKQAPDVSVLSDVWWFKFYLNQMLAPLTDLLAANEIDTGDYVDSLYNEGVRDGVSYWLPFARSTPLFYYNKDMFAEVGLDAAPETWDEFVAVAPQLVQKDGDTVTRSAFAHPNSGILHRVALPAGGLAVRWRLLRPRVQHHAQQEKAVAAGKFYRSSVADGWATTPDDPETRLRQWSDGFDHGLHWRPARHYL